MLKHCGLRIVLTLYVKWLRSTRFVFLVGICSVFVPESFAQLAVPQQEQPSKPALQTVIAEQVAVDLVGTLFLFDRLFTKSRTATSPDYLERVSEPSSKFYPHYLEYKQGRIARAEIVRRLPHIAMLGDSLSQNFYISSVPSMFWRARTERRKNWFLDTDPAPQSIYSVYERLEKFTPLVATECSCDGAKVGPGQTPEDFARKLAGTRNLSGQVRQVLRNKRFPDLVMVWIGHNNTDWIDELPVTEREHPQKRLQEMARQFGQNYTQSMRPLIDCAKMEDHKVAFLVFGLADYKTFFKCRQKAEALHESNPKVYPYFEITCQRFESFKPAYQKDTTQFALMMNGELRTMVANLNRELKDCPNVRLHYSDAFSNVEIRPEVLHPKDSWHLSRIGHNVVAQAAFDALLPSLQFLGIVPKPIRSP
jgi:lysophospholipase L1-like esterase